MSLPPQASTREGASAVIEVSDDGPGVPRALRKRIFETGVSTKPQGWGVGLSLSRRIVEDYHGGRIWVEKTAPNRGTTITMTFPT